MCEPDWKVSLLGSAYALPWFLMLIILPRLADKVGRKWIFLVSRLLESLTLVVVLSTTNYYVMMVALLTVGLCATGRVNVGVVYLNEWFPRRW